MSTLDLDVIREHIKRAHDEVCGLADGSRDWRMRIPAQPERDSDLVIAAALEDAEKLVAELERLRAAVDRVRALHRPEPVDASCDVRDCCAGPHWIEVCEGCGHIGDENCPTLDALEGESSQ